MIPLSEKKIGYVVRLEAKNPLLLEKEGIKGIREVWIKGRDTLVVVSDHDLSESELTKIKSIIATRKLVVEPLELAPGEI